MVIFGRKIEKTIHSKIFLTIMHSVLRLHLDSKFSTKLNKTVDFNIYYQIICNYHLQSIYGDVVFDQVFNDSFIGDYSLFNSTLLLQQPQLFVKLKGNDRLRTRTRTFYLRGLSTISNLHKYRIWFKRERAVKYQS